MVSGKYVPVEAVCRPPVTALVPWAGQHADTESRCRLAAFAEVGRCRQGDEPFCLGSVVSYRQHGEDESAFAQTDLFDQQWFPAAREDDHVTWVKLTRHDLVLHGPRRYRLAEPVSPCASGERAPDLSDNGQAVSRRCWSSGSNRTP
jgi:hypothetical protein